MSDPRSRYDRWAAATDGPLLALAFLFTAAFVLPLYRPDLPGWVRRVVDVLDVLIWAAFGLDYLVRLHLSEQRLAFVRRHVPDLFVLALPLLRPLRLLRLVALFGAATRRLGRRARVRTTYGAVAAVTVLVVVCGGLVLEAERASGDANITSAGDALWWAATTITTVGYGDRFPTTGEGRVVGVLLMLGGIALLGVLTASIAAWFVTRFNALEELEDVVQAEGDESAQALRELAARMDRLEHLLREVLARDASAPADRQS